jgi:hypothetical protein
MNVADLFDFYFVEMLFGSLLALSRKPAAIFDKRCRSRRVADLRLDDFAQQPAVGTEGIRPAIAAKHV